ncbi:MAG: CBS domain-containing protein [Desulfobacteraceae bacterium]|jgi:nanoRNase/pAp phosphatase (c-di-AMP/oligoRNAs hydrolase)|nr:CBS domain-containing protein [Desulfobacteraceae bacterium]
MQIVTTHQNTDFDALASVIAATLIYSDSIPILPKSLNPNVKSFLSIHKDLLPVGTIDEIDLGEITRLIVVDVNRWERLDRMADLRSKADLEIFLWDHHTNPGDIKADFQCQETSGANVTLLIRQIQKERKLITPIQATLFLAGIYEDTGNLTFPATTAEDAHAAAYLLEHKADLKIISTFLRPAYGEKQKNILFKMLETARRTKINGYTVSINTIEVRGHVESLAVVVRMYMEIVNVDVTFGIFSDSDRQRCMVIGRSSADGFDIGAIMRSLGGGGHPNAGAALLKSVTAEAAATRIQELIEGGQQSSVQISDLMSFPVITVTDDTSMDAVAGILRKKGCTGLPVVNNGSLVGMISRRDFRRIKKDSQLTAPVKAFMTPNVRTIDPGKSPVEAARLMVKHDIGRLPVVEDGKIIGIITRSDTMLYFYDLLPD